MKKWIAIALCMALMGCAAAAASAETAAPSSLFGYVFDVAGTSFQIMTDSEVQLTFQKDENTAIQSADGALHVDDAVLVQYTGGLNLDTEMQSVRVNAVSQLHVLDGIVKDGTMSTISVQTYNDDASEGPVYLFDRESCDITTGEDGILIGDGVEVAYKGDPSQLVPDQVQSVDYVHITVYGQIEDTLE